MTNWFAKRKEKRAFESAKEDLETLHGNLQKIYDKLNEIKKSDLTDVDKKGLLDILNIQRVNTENDILAFGVTMSRFYDAKLVDGNIPIGVDITQAENVADYIYMDATRLIDLEGKRASQYSEMVSKVILHTQVSDIITDQKLDTIKTLKINSKIKSKLKKIQDKYASDRLEVVEATIEKIDDKDETLVFERDLFENCYAFGGLDFNAERISSSINCMKHKLKVPNALYKSTFLTGDVYDLDLFDGVDETAQPDFNAKVCESLTGDYSYCFDNTNKSSVGGSISD